MPERLGLTVYYAACLAAALFFAVMLLVGYSNGVPVIGVLIGMIGGVLVWFIGRAIRFVLVD